VRLLATHVAVLVMDNGENRFNGPFVESLLEAMDKIDGMSDIRVLILTGSGKFFTNGLNLQWIGSNSDAYSKFRSRQVAISASDLSRSSLQNERILLSTAVSSHGHNCRD